MSELSTDLDTWDLRRRSHSQGQMALIKLKELFTLPKQKQIVRQALSETILLCMDELVCHADDLESTGDFRLAEAVRHLAGEMENLVFAMQKGGKYYRKS